MGLWDGYDHPKHQTVPIDRMAGIAQLLAGLGAFCTPLCIGLALSVAAIVLAHRVQSRLSPYDVAGARMARTALLVAYPTVAVVGVITLAFALIGLVFLENQPAGIALLIVFLFLTLVTCLAVLAWATIWIAMRLSSRGLEGIVTYRP